MTKAKASPAGDQRNRPTPALASVTCRASPPAIGMTQIWFLSERAVEKASHWPSGENAGLPAECSPLVNRTLRLPSADATQMWLRYSDFSPSMRGSRTT